MPYGLVSFALEQYGLDGLSIVKGGGIVTLSVAVPSATYAGSRPGVTSAPVVPLAALSSAKPCVAYSAATPSLTLSIAA